MNKLIKSIVIIALLSGSSIAHAEENDNQIPKIYKNIKLETKNGDIVYRIFDKRLPLLNNSISKINSNLLISKGYTGQGYTVALIDTGVDFTHSFLDGKKAGEACFTSSNSCPNSTNSMIGDGAARPVHWHGTHVAGIIAGSNSSMHGVAPGAKILAINVFETDTSANEESIISALEYVNSVRTKLNIVSVNLSLGTSRMWTGICDDVSPELTTIIHTLISNRVAIVAASGNSSSYGMSNPACISGVTSVAASYSDKDDITDFSNISNYTTFAAPGYKINSSFSNNGYRESSGTSMSTPHVAGAFALYNSFKPNLSVEQQVSNLKTNCPKSYDAPTKISICRLDFSYIANGQSVLPPVTTTVPPVSTTVPPVTTTVPPVTTTVPPVTTIVPTPVTTIPVPNVYKTMLGKPRLVEITLWKSGTAFISYFDSINSKNLVKEYLLNCNDNSTYTIIPELNFNSHVYSIPMFSTLATSCFMRAVDFNLNYGPSTLNVSVTKY